jgi:streptomycin 6-kinase
VAVAVGILVVSVSITRSDVGHDIARRTADVYHALPNAQRDRTVIIGDVMHAFVLTGEQVPWTVLWPHLRTLTVS